MKKAFLKSLNRLGYDLVRYKKPGAEVNESERVDRYRADSLKPRGVNKIFGIGYNKTGTTTLNEIFKAYGFRVPKQGRQERDLTWAVFNGRFEAFRQFVDRFDAFQDMPFSQHSTYVVCDVLFPGSKFILTIRDEDDWYRSNLNFDRNLFGFESPDELTEDFFKDKNLYLHKNYVYHSKRRMLARMQGDRLEVDWNLLYDEEHYKRLYRARNEAILKYFQDRPGDLLVIDITRERDTRRIVEFLGLPADSVRPMPHKNRATVSRVESG